MSIRCIFGHKYIEHSRAAITRQSIIWDHILNQPQFNKEGKILYSGPSLITIFVLKCERCGKIIDKEVSGNHSKK